MGTGVHGAGRGRLTELVSGLVKLILLDESRGLGWVVLDNVTRPETETTLDKPVSRLVAHGALLVGLLQQRGDLGTRWRLRRRVRAVGCPLGHGLSVRLGAGRLGVGRSPGGGRRKAGVIGVVAEELRRSGVCVASPLYLVKIEVEHLRRGEAELFLDGGVAIVEAFHRQHVDDDSGKFNAACPKEGLDVATLEHERCQVIAVLHRDLEKLGEIGEDGIVTGGGVDIDW